MSTSMNVLVFSLVLINVLGCLWLIWWTSRRQPNEEAEGTEKSHVWDDDLRELNNPLPRWWLNLFLITIVFALAYLVLYPGMGDFAGTLGWTQQGQHDERLDEVNAKRQAHFAQFETKDVWDLSNDVAAAQAGGRLFADNCAGCHGPSAQGAIGFPRLTDAAWLYGNKPAQIRHSIENGRTGTMPSFLASLPAQDTADLVALLQNWEKPKLKDAALAAVQQRFSTTCAACHGADGTGNPFIGAPNLRDDYWLYGNDAESIRYSITFGRSGAMPAHKDLLSDVEMTLLTAYLLRISGSQK